jgi:hypothetical protein
MRFIWIGAFILIFASLASLISNEQSGRLFEESWAGTANVLPEPILNELQHSVPAYTDRLFSFFPEPFQDRFAAKTRRPVELMTLRSLLLWHLVPGLLMAVLVGFLEGSWDRENQKTLIKMHSPMRFSMSLTAFGLSPILAALWITAPIVLPATLFVFTIGAFLLFSTRNLMVHAPTQF